MKQLIGRTLYLIAGVLLTVGIMSTGALKRVNAIRAAHIDGVFNSFQLGCVMASEDKEGSNARCKKMALKHQAEIRKIVNE